MNKTEKQLLEQFLSSYNEDKRLAKYDIQSCIVWTEMLVKQGIVEKTKAKKVISKLKELQHKFDKIKINKTEDVHYVVETMLENLLGKDKLLSGIIRTGRSRNDLVVNDERLFLKDEIKEIIKLLKQVIVEILKLAEKNLDVIMCGMTHLQPAQPVLFSHYIMSFSWMFYRDIERLKDCLSRVDVSVLGSSAFSGTTLNIDRKEVAKKLGFSKVSTNSVDSVSDRDYVIEFISSCAILMMHLSRMMEEFILWLTPNFGYISLPPQLTTGSSIMPQKQNPDYLELTRGKTAVVYGSLVGILTLMKSLPLSYNRDMQEDKLFLNKTVDTVKECLQVVKIIIKNLKVNKEQMNKSVEHGFILATELANWLVTNLGIPFKSAHKIVSKIVEYCVKNQKNFIELEYEEIARTLNNKKFNKEKFLIMKKEVSVENVIMKTNTYGGTSLSRVKQQISELKNILKTDKK